MTVVEGYRQRKADVQQEKQFALTSQAQELALKQGQATLAAEEKFLELTKGVGSGMAPGGKPGSPPAPEDLSKSLAFMANAAAKAGQPERAAELAAKASTITSNASLIKQRSLEDNIKKAELAKSLLQGFEEEGGSQEGWDQMIALFQMQTGEASPYAGMEYTPELFEQVKGSVTSALDKAKIATEQERAKATAALRQERIARQPLIKSQIELNEARKEQLGKEGVGKISPSQLTSAVKNLIGSKYVFGTKEELGMRATAIGERAAELQRQNTGLTVTQAAERAFQESEGNNEFVGVQMTSSSRLPRVGSIKNPRPMTKPKSKDPADFEKWRKEMLKTPNDVRVAPDGTLWKLNKEATGFEEITK